MHNQTAFGQTSIGGSNFEGFREVMSLDLMKVNEVLGNKSSCHSKVNDGSGFNGFQTSFGNKSHQNTQFLSFSNSLYKSYCYIGRYWCRTSLPHQKFSARQRFSTSSSSSSIFSCLTRIFFFLSGQWLAWCLCFQHTKHRPFAMHSARSSLSRRCKE